MSSTSDPEQQQNEVVARIVRALAQYTLLKRELHWYRIQEPEQYAKMLADIKTAIYGHN